MMSSAIVSDVFYVTHEMVAFKEGLNGGGGSTCRLSVKIQLLCR